MSPESRRRPHTGHLREVLGRLVAAVVFVACIVVVVIAQQSVAWSNLVVMLGALAVLILLLGLYNRRFR